MAIVITVLIVLTIASTMAYGRAQRRNRALMGIIEEAADHLGAGGPDEDVARALPAAAERSNARAISAVSAADTYERAMAAAEIGVLVVDNDGSIVFTNDTARRYVGARHGDAVAEVEVQELIADVTARRKPSRRELELFTPTRRVLGLSSVPLVHDGRPVGAAVFLEDHTERHRIDAIRKDFVANASHELKTPIGALSVLSETLADADDPAVRARLTARLTKETRRLSNLIDDILDLSIVEAVTGDRAPVTIDEVLTDAVKHVSVISDDYGIPTNMEPAGPDVRVLGDHRQLVSAVSNLLENAIKYTLASGEDTVSPVELRARSEADRVIIEVEDHGIGISDHHLPRIFERFYRVDRARSRETGGTGLGLAIVRHVVLNHEGTIEVQSTPSVGTVFTIGLPCWSTRDG